MKTKNKARMNVIVAAFVAILMVGTAFAFVGANPLVFQGNVSFEGANLLVAIQNEVEIETLHYANVATATIRPGSEIGENHHKISDIHVNFVGNGTATLDYTIENLGSMAAEVNVRLIDTFGFVDAGLLTIVHDFVNIPSLGVAATSDIEFVINLNVPQSLTEAQADALETLLEYGAEFRLVLDYVSATLN